VNLLRRTLATKLLAGGLVLSLTLILSVSGYLVVQNNIASRAASQSNADNRAALVRQLIQRITAPQARAGAEDLAGLNSLSRALSGTNPAADVPALFAPGSKVAVRIPDEDTVIFGASGGVLYSSETEPDPALRISAATPSVRLALAGQPAQGTEVLGGLKPVYDVAVPAQGADGRRLGVVVYSAPLSAQLIRIAAAASYPASFATNDDARRLIRLPDGARGNVPAELVGGIAAGRDSVSATYTSPGVGEVAGSFLPMSAPGTSKPAGYLGVEAPLAELSNQSGADRKGILAIALTAAGITTVVVLLFVIAFVRRPIHVLKRGVSRIAGGDYTTDVAVTSQDELGDLASSVNRMREQIARYIRHIDASIVRLGDVSRALTTTTGGVGKLQEAVLSAAAAIAGDSAQGTLFLARDGALVPYRRGEDGGAPPALTEEAARTVLAGHHVRATAAREWYLLVVPMFYQDEVSGAVAVVTPAEVSESDERALVALANNGAIALENTRLYEQEKATVVKLRELDAMKSDFLTTAQHELRTPVLAIMGQTELMTIGWDSFDDAAKRDLVRDIEISIRLMGELVETIIDFSLLDGDRVTLHRSPVVVADVVTTALADVTSHFRDGLPVEVGVRLEPGLLVSADEKRFLQVLRCLLDNAVKFTPKGGRVDLEAHHESDGTLCRIEIADNGIGISPAALPHIFERFYQEDNSKTRSYGGLGMGLALVQRLCDAHGAAITVRSTKGGGTRVSLEWRTAVAAPPVAAGVGGFHLAF
jgi:signal transduction histidine kinase